MTPETLDKLCRPRVQVLAAEGTPGWPEFQQRVFDAWTSLSGVPAPPKPHWCA